MKYVKLYKNDGPDKPQRVGISDADGRRAMIDSLKSYYDDPEAVVDGLESAPSEHNTAQTPWAYFWCEPSA